MRLLLKQNLGDYILDAFVMYLSLLRFIELGFKC